jgi:tRNA (pseudouridine54-N1)-methyltransferase
LHEFVLYSRLGRTDSNWTNLHDAGRLDIVYECIIASLFLSHAIRKDTTFHATLNGPPNPPLHIEIQGEKLHDVRTDQQTWTQILKKILSRKPHPGITLVKASFESLIKAKAQEAQIYILEEHGKDITEIAIDNKPMFILGDHVGLPKKVENFALRYGEKISLGKQPYLAATCITILNYLLDRKTTNTKDYKS